MITEVNFCASCYATELELLHDFGKVPLAGYFPIPGTENELNRIPMTLLLCKNCSLIQINPFVHDTYLFSDYRYRSLFSMKRHFQELSSWIVSKGFSNESRILEIGSNDGTLLSELIARKYNPIGVDPATNIIEHSIKQGHRVIPGHFSENLVNDKGLEESFDLVISCNSFAHIANIRDIARATSRSLVIGGFFLIEVQAWEELIQRKAFDFVYHEHKYYYTIASMKNLLGQFGFQIESVEKIDSHGGSFRFLFKKVDSMLRKENRNFEVNQNIRDTFNNSITGFYNELNLLHSRMIQIRSSGGKIVGFGASGRANMLLAYMNTKGLLDAVYDESPERIGRSMGFTGIKVKDFTELRPENYTHCLVLAWNFYDSIIQKWPHAGKVLLRPLPELAEFRS